MGRVKQEWIEAEERGYRLPEEKLYVCADHFEDIYLREYIDKNSVKGKCDYCGKRTKVIDIRDFLEYVCEKIITHYNNPDNEELLLSSLFYDDDNEVIPGFKRVGCFVAPSYAKNYDSTRELLYSLDLWTDDKRLNSDIENCFTRDEWIQANACCMTKSQELSLLWNLFARMVKYEQRFTFFKNSEYTRKSVSGDNGLLDILTELDAKITQHKLIRKIEIGAILYRCRFIDDKEVVDSFDKITSAPDDKAKQSRMSPAGVSMFYGNFDESTAILESCPDGRKIDGTYVVGIFKVKKVLRILDLTDLPKYSFWMPGDREGIAFLHSFNNEITKSIIRDDRIQIEYVPSQVFTEYVRCLYKYNRKNIDGIIYKSSVSKAKRENIVLFYNQRKSPEVLELINLKHSNDL
jgi:hypothetical protein